MRPLCHHHALQSDSALNLAEHNLRLSSFVHLCLREHIHARIYMYVCVIWSLKRMLVDHLATLQCKLNRHLPCLQRLRSWQEAVKPSRPSPYICGRLQRQALGDSIVQLVRSDRSSAGTYHACASETELWGSYPWSFIVHTGA